MELGDLDNSAGHLLKDEIFCVNVTNIITRKWYRPASPRQDDSKIYKYGVIDS